MDSSYLRKDSQQSVEKNQELNGDDQELYQLELQLRKSQKITAQKIE